MSRMYLAQVTFEHDSGLPEDRIVNTWHFLGPDAPAAADLTALTTGIANFYGSDTVQTLWSQAAGARAVVNYMSEALANGAAHTIKVYDLTEPEPRVPIRTANPNLTFDTMAGLPSEVAVCLSMRRLPVSGSIPARERGRVFIGPLSLRASSQPSSGEPRVSLDFQHVLLQAAITMVNALSAGAGNWVLSVLSRAGGGTHVPVEQFWVDNAFDTQRRRGPKSTSRIYLT